MGQLWGSGAMEPCGNGGGLLCTCVAGGGGGGVTGLGLYGVPMGSGRGYGPLWGLWHQGAYGVCEGRWDTYLWDRGG